MTSTAFSYSLPHTDSTDTVDLRFKRSRWQSGSASLIMDDVVVTIAAYYDGNNVHSVKRLIGVDKMRFTDGGCNDAIVHDFNKIKPGVI